MLSMSRGFFVSLLSWQFLISHLFAFSFEQKLAYAVVAISDYRIFSLSVQN